LPIFKLKTGRPVPVENLKDDVLSLTDKIRSGEAFLKVVAYPWGVEFDLCDNEKATS